MYKLERDKIVFHWARADVFKGICNASSMNAKMIGDDTSIADKLVISDDEIFFFDSHIDDILSRLASYFVRIFISEQNIINTSDEIGLLFRARTIIKNQYFDGELEILHNACEEFINTNLLAAWYSYVGINENLAKQYTAKILVVDSQLRNALFQFVKPINNGRSQSVVQVSIDECRHTNHCSRPQRPVVFKEQLRISYSSSEGYISEPIKVTTSTLHIEVKTPFTGDIYIDVSESGDVWIPVQCDELPLGGTDIYMVNMKPTKYVRLRAAFEFNATKINEADKDPREVLSVVGVRWIQRIGDDLMVCHTDGRTYSAGKIYNGNVEVRLYKYASILPAVPHQPIQYSLKTSEIVSSSETLSGWSPNIPEHNSLLPCWIIKQNVSGHGASDGVILYPDKWSNPIKMF